MKKVTENASFQKRSPEWRFLKMSAFRLLVDGQKWRFSNTMIFCIIYYKPYACSVRDAIVFLLFWRFSMVGRKRIEYATCGRVLFCKRRERSPFSKISGYMWKEPWRLEKESKVRVSKTRGLGLSFFNECCFRVTVKVRVRVDINSKPNLILTPTVTQKQQSFFFFFF